MPLRRSRGVLPFLVLAVALFRFQSDVSFCGVSSISSHRRSGQPARVFKMNPFQGKSAQPDKPRPVQNISAMTTGDVSDWLTSLGFEKYVPNFEDAVMNGGLLETSTHEDLREIGVKLGIHRKNILTHRDALVENGWKKTTSSSSLWQPEPKDMAPDGDVKRFAPAVLKHMRKEEPIGAQEEALVTELDNILADMLERSDLFFTLEAANDIVWSRTATVRGVSREGVSVRDQIKGDQLQILEQQKAQKEGITAFLSAIHQVANEMFNYERSMKEKTSESERRVAKSQFEEFLQTWKEKNFQLAKNTLVCPQALRERVYARFLSELPGGRAVQANLDLRDELRQKKEEAAIKCQRIYHLAEPDVQLALKARKVGLKEMIQDEEERLRSLAKRRNELEGRRKEYEQLKQKNDEVRSEQRNATKHIRDWHVRKWWNWAWKQEMEVYEKQGEKDEERLAADDQNLDMKLKTIEENLKRILDEEVKVQETIQDLKSKDSEEFWKKILEATGLFDAESEVEDIGKRLDLLWDQLLAAVEKTGVLDPHLAASLLAHSETTKDMLSEAVEKSTGTAVQMQAWVDQAVTISDSSHALDVLPTALLSLQQAHQTQMRSRKKSMAKHAALKRFMESATVFLDPTDPNVTLTA